MKWLRFKDENGNDYPAWAEKAIKEIFESKRGKVIPINKISKKQNQIFKYPVYSSQTVNKGIVGYFDKWLFEDALIWTTDGYAGKVRYIKNKFYCSNVAGILKSKDGYANKTIETFLNFLTPKYVTNSGIPKLNQKNITNIKIPFPVLEEQTKISAFLTNIENYIELIEDELKFYNEYRDNLSSKIFTQNLRFKDENGNDYPAWAEKAIKEIFEVKKGNKILPKEIVKKQDQIFKYPIYSSQTVNNGIVGYFDKWLFEDALIWTTDGCYAGKVRYIKNKFYCSNHTGILKSKDGYTNKAIETFLNFLTPKYVTNSVIPNLTQKNIAGIKIPFPILEEQTKIAAFLTNIENYIELIEDELKFYNEYRKLLAKMICNI